MNDPDSGRRPVSNPGALPCAFTYELRGPVVAVVDQGGDRSVTNAAEDVIADLVGDGLDLDGRRVVYRDDLGTWDELVVHDNRFERFNLLDAPTLEHAIAQLARNRPRLGHTGT